MKKSVRATKGGRKVKPRGPSRRRENGGERRRAAGGAPLVGQNRLHFWRSSLLRLRTACPLRSHLSMIILLSDVDHARRRRRAKQNFILLLARRRRRAWSTRESTGLISQRVLMGSRSEVSAVKTARSATLTRFWRPRVTPAGRRALSEAEEGRRRWFLGF